MRLSGHPHARELVSRGLPRNADIVVGGRRGDGLQRRSRTLKQTPSNKFVKAFYRLARMQSEQLSQVSNLLYATGRDHNHGNACG